MTALVGLVEDGQVWMGCDSAAIDERGSISIREGPAKIHGHKNDKYLIGVAGSSRVNQVIRHIHPKHDEQLPDYTLPSVSEVKGWQEWVMIECVVPFIRQALDNNLNPDERKEANWTALVAFEHALYKVYDDLSVERSIRNFNAAGSGENAALGSLFSSAVWTANPKKRVELSLRAADYVQADVALPFHVYQLINGAMLSRYTLTEGKECLP